MFGESYTFILVQKDPSHPKGGVREKFSLAAKSKDSAICAIVHFRNTKHEGKGIIFESTNLQDSKMLQLLRGGPTPEKSTEYYGYIKGHEDEILSALKTIKSSSYR